MQVTSFFKSKASVSAIVLLAALLVAGCAGRQGSSMVVYDFGPGALTKMPETRMAPLSPLALPPVQSTRVLDSTAMVYRLIYKDVQQPKPYAQARWSMPVGELLDQKLRQQLGQRRSLINPQDNLQIGKNVRILQLQLEELSQVFEAPDRSIGLVKIRATLSEPSTKGARLLAQRSFTVQQPSPTPDAAGGVHAITAAVQILAEELEQWIEQQPQLSE